MTDNNGQEKVDLASLEVAQMPPEQAIEELSDMAVRILAGAEVYEGHHWNGTGHPQRRLQYR